MAADVTPLHPPPPPAGGNGHGLDHETLLIGALLQRPARITDCPIRPDQYHRPIYGTIHEAITAAATQHDDPALTHVLDAIRRRPDAARLLDQLGNGTVLADLASTPSATPASLDYYAEHVADAHRLRVIGRTGHRLVQLAEAAQQGLAGAPGDALEHAMRELMGADHAPARSLVTVQNIDEFLAVADDDYYDWVIPGLLERHDRLILTGPEGGGKSTWCRQLAIMAAAGLHPFTGELLDQKPSVLLVDLENSERQARRKLNPLRVKAGDLLDPDRLHIEVRPSGIDLLNDAERAWLLSLLDAVQPDLLITGPLYRMASGDPTEERTAKPVSQALDDVRGRGCAVTVEAHSPHEVAGQRKRPRRPYGASLWKRWPEFGIYLGEDGEIDHWRGARDEREWPARMKRGGEWPWTPETDQSAILWARIIQTRREFGAEMSVRDLGDAMGVSKSRIGRALQDHADQWADINSEPPDEEY